MLLRRPRLDYTAPGICEIILSGSGSSVIVSTFETGIKIVDFTVVGLMLEWPNVPGALCYTIYRQVESIGLPSTFAVLAASTITNTGPTTINGDLGLSPGTSVTGFPPGIVTGTQHITDSEAAQAQIDLTAAYLDLEGRSGGIPVAGNIGGQTLTPGVYKSSSTLAISSGELTLDAQGDVNAVWIFQIASSLTTTSGRQIILTGGAQAANVFWQVGSSATLGTGSVFKGNILALTSITVTTGATVEGRMLAQNGAVTLDSNVIVVPISTVEPGAFVILNECTNSPCEGDSDSQCVVLPGPGNYRVSVITADMGESDLSDVILVV